MIAAATRERVAAAAKELGYQPHLVASGLRRGQTLTVGVVVPDLANPIYAPFARGVTHALEKSGYMPLFADTQDDHDRLERTVQHLAERRVDAIVTTAARLPDESVLVALQEQGVPVVMAIRTVTRSGLATVTHDDEYGGRLAAEHLLGLRHRRLAQILGPMDVEPFVRRERGFAQAARHGVASLLQPPDVQLTTDDLTANRGREVATALLDRPADERPTGIFVQNDVMALGVLQAVRDLGLRCPDDVSIVGYNDAFFAAHTDPPLTTVRLDAYVIGRRSGAMALALIADPADAHSEESVPPVLVERGSTAVPPP